MDVKNKFLQDVNGPSSHRLSNGSSLNRIIVFQDRVSGERGSYDFISLTPVSFWNMLMPLYGLNQSSNIFKNKKIYGLFWKFWKHSRIVKVIEHLELEYFWRR